ncbi:MAG: hypothetical protein JWM80_1402, partial [Cyanobacteria bacterium RYN_339]|nr:hypothetical protein [Cyanobacteria bacterium RYN_339]
MHFKTGRRPGLALVNVLMLTMLSTVFLIAATRFVSDTLKESRNKRSYQQVYSIAKSGLDEAISYMRKQPSKPLASFDYVGDPSHLAPPDSLNEQIGLVKEWEIDPMRHLWARFEVGREAGAPARTGLINGVGATLTAGSDGGTLYGAGPVDWAAKDISLQRGRTRQGEVWRLRSRAYTFQRPASTATPSFNLTNPVLKPIQRIELETEV